MRAVQITCFGGPEVLEIVDVPEATPGPGPQLYDVSTAGSTTPTPTTAWRENHFSTTTEFRHYGLGPVCCPVRGLTVSRRCVLFESPDVEGRAAEHCPQPR